MSERNKDGRLTESEIKYLRDNYDKKDHIDLAKDLKRNPNTIKKILKKLIAEDNTKGAFRGMVSAHDLRSQPFWEQLKLQFSKEELKEFEAHWNGIIGEQFKEDILYTEKLQLKSLLETNILLGRNMANRLKNIEDQKRLEQLRDMEYQLDAKLRDNQWQERVFSIESQISAIRDSAKANTDEQTKLQATAVRLNDELKGSRKARVEKATDASMGWTDLLRKLEEEEFRNKAVRQSRLLDMASEKVKNEFGALHEYMDKTLDRPILNSETVLKDEEEDEAVSDL